MALRVLLADESSTIKKVFQLALQDFSIEVKSTPVGDDVLSVAQSFKPDLIFVDVLLAKKSGYDVCAELKSNPSVSSIPVVLMWSGFMELDQQRVQLARPDRRLEKPFDAETLRKLVRELVPATGSNEISKFLKFPNLPSFDEPKSPAQSTGAGTTPPHSAQPPSVHTPLELSDEPDEFEMAPPPNRAGQPGGAGSKKEESDQWASGVLSGLSIPQLDTEPLKLNQDVLNFDDAAISMMSAQGDLQEIKLSDIEEVPTAGLKFSTQNTKFQLDPTHAEQVLREQVREVLQKVAWQILPDIAEKVVREEIQKLLKESDRLT